VVRSGDGKQQVGDVRRSPDAYSPTTGCWPGDWQTLGDSASPLSLVARAAGGEAAAALVEVSALTSTANTILILLLSTSRMVYGLSRSEYRPSTSLFARGHGFVDRWRSLDNCSPRAARRLTPITLGILLTAL